MSSVSTHLERSEIQLSAEEQARVLTQLDLMLTSKHFCNSKRYPAFLRFVVHATLRGEGSELKERRLGIDVFGRVPDYDTGDDPIVRVTAGEVRKRIAQYYDAEGHFADVRIYLPSGSYIPEFHFLGQTLIEELSASAEDSAQIDVSPIEEDLEEFAPIPVLQRPETTPSPKVHFFFSRTFRYALISACVLAVIAGVWTMSARERQKRFWQPFISSTRPTLIVVGPAFYQQAGPIPSPTLSAEEEARLSRTTVLSDAMSAAYLCSILHTDKHRCRIIPVSSVTLTDLRSDPAVLLGAFNNEWMKRLTDPLRFHITYGEYDPSISPYRLRYILDRKSNSPTSPWHVDPSTLNRITVDYSIVARFHNNVTDNIVIAAAGLTQLGTVGAAEFLIDPQNTDQLEQATHGHKDWNVEAVLETQIVDRQPGHTRIVAVDAWP